MRWRHSLCCGLLVLSYCSNALAELDLADASQHTLDNGLTVLILEEHSFPLVSVQMLYRAGARDEVPGLTGLAHFVEHMAFRGSKNFPDTGLVREVYAVGGEWHGYTWIDQTTYFATVPAEHLHLLLDIEADRMTRLDIATSDIPAERGAVLAEMHGYENDMSAVLHDASIYASLLAHPYRNNTIGWESDVKAIGSDDVAGFYARHYQPGNAILAIVGDVQTDVVLHQVRERFADLPGRDASPLPRTIEPAQTGERRVSLESPVTAQYFQFVWHAPAAASADYPAFLLLQELLSASSGTNFLHNDWGTAARPDSLLGGISADIRSWFIPTAQPYVFAIKGSIPEAGNRLAVEVAVAQATETLRSAPASKPEFERARARLLDRLLLDVQTTEDAAHQLAYFAGIDALDALLDLSRQIKALRPADVQRVAQRYLAASQRTIAWSSASPPEQMERSSEVALPMQLAARPQAAKAGQLSPGRPAKSRPVPTAEVLHLKNGAPVILQYSELSATVHLEVVIPGRWQGADAAFFTDYPVQNSSAFSKTRPATELEQLVIRAAATVEDLQASAASAAAADDPYLRMQQVFARQMSKADTVAVDREPQLIVVAGKFDRRELLRLLNKHFSSAIASRSQAADEKIPGHARTVLADTGTTTAKAVNSGDGDDRNRTLTEKSDAPAPAGQWKTNTAATASESQATLLTENIPLPLAQTRLGYIVNAPPPGDQAADVWRALLYILSHDYEGRLGKEAISRRGLVYYIDSEYRSDGASAWITLSIGVDPNKLNAMRDLLQQELQRLLSEPPSAVELDEALAHRLGRARSAAQSNAELAEKLGREWLWHGQLETPDALLRRLSRISQHDLQNALRAFTRGTIVQITSEPIDDE